MANNIVTPGYISGSQLISTITSAPPIQVTNTNLVSNLNVQYFNGQLSSYYTNASNISSGVLNPTFGGTGLSTISNGYLFLASNNIFTQSSNLYYNFSSNFFGINTSNPAYPLDINGNTNIKGNLTISGNIIVTGVSSSNPNSNTPSILSVTTGGTGLSNVTQGTLLFGQGSNSLGSSSNLFWNSVSNFLGIGNNSPGSMLDITAGSNYPFTVRGSPSLNRQIRLIPSSNNSPVEILFQQNTIFDNITNAFWTGIYNNPNSITFYGICCQNTNGNILSVTCNGYVGIGTVTPSNALDVVGNIRASSNITSSNQFISTVVTGTAPLNITSTTLVSNLNVQLLGGQSNTFYTNVNNVSSGILSVTYGGTGLNSLQQGYIPFGTGSTTFSSSSNFFWNSGSSRLGIGTSNPSSALDAVGGGIFRSNNNQLTLYNNTTTVGDGCEIKFLSCNGTGWGIGQNTFSAGPSNFGFYNMYTNSFPLIINSSNYIGIGANNSNSMLDITAGSRYCFTVRGSSNGRQIRIIPLSNNSTSEIMFQQYTDFDNTTNTFYTGVYGSGSYYGIASQSFPNIITATSNGYVGICTNTPSNALDVVGNIRVSSNITSSNQFISTIATGTPPLSITSSTLVSNLNVQYLGGQSNGYYTNVNNINQGILSVTYGGTGLSSITQGFIPFGRGSSSLGSSSNLFWDSNNSRLGIGTSNPTTALNVAGQGLFTDTVKQKRYYFRVQTYTNTQLSNGNNLMGYQYLLDPQNIASSNFNSNMSIFYPPVPGVWSFTTSAWLAVGSNIGAYELYVVRATSNVGASTTSNTSYIATTGSFYTTQSSCNCISANGMANLSNSNTDYISVCIWNQGATQNVATDNVTQWRCMFQGTLLQPS